METQEKEIMGCRCGHRLVEMELLCISWVGKER